jgi:PAS domain S-box-containing protein
MFGYTRDELIGQPVEQLIPERYRGAHLSQRAGFFHSPSPRPMGVGRDLYGLRKDGTEFPVEIGLNPIKTNAVMSVLCTIIDITKRKQVEEVHLESMARKEFALETSQMGEWDLDLSNHTTTRSLRHDQIFGYQSLLPEWTYEMFLGHVVPEDRDRVDRTFQQAVEAHSRWDFECRIIRVDKEVRWIRAQGRPRQDVSSHSMRLTGVVQDITEQKQAGDALHREEVLRRVFEERESLARNLHDGILQSLYAVRLGLEGCRRSFVMSPQRAIPEIDARIKDVGLVIEEVRDFMTGEDPAWVRTSDLRKGIEKLLQANRAEDRQVWRLHAPEQDGVDGLSSVEIKHLLYMAHEAMSNVARHSSAESCDVTLASDDDRLRLTIEDDGVGFAADTARGSGQGLGYMEARARQIGATLDIASAPGRGTHITIEITKRKTHVSS